MNLLIVDDELNILKGLEEEIDWKEYGFSEVFVAQDGESVRELLKRVEIALVICDHEMPNEDGFLLVEFIRKNYMLTDYMIMSEKTDFESMRRAIQCRVYDYIKKPIDLDVLKESVDRYVSQKRSKQMERRLNQAVVKTETIRGAEDTAKMRIGIVKGYIEEHIHEKIYIEDLAKLIHVNEQYFTRLFRRLTGQSVMEYITERRVSLAAAMLKNTDLSINFIAESVGCANYSYFTKMFKKYEGHTPREYRNMYQK